MKIQAAFCFNADLLVFYFDFYGFCTFGFRQRKREDGVFAGGLSVGANPDLRSSEQFEVRAHTFESKRIAFDSVNENPIGFYMTIAIIVPFAA